MLWPQGDFQEEDLLCSASCRVCKVCVVKLFRNFGCRVVLSTYYGIDNLLLIKVISFKVRLLERSIFNDKKPWAFHMPGDFAGVKVTTSVFTRASIFSPPDNAGLADARRRDDGRWCARTRTLEWREGRDARFTIVAFNASDATRCSLIIMDRIACQLPTYSADLCIVRKCRTSNKMPFKENHVKKRWGFVSVVNVGETSRVERYRWFLDASCLELHSYMSHSPAPFLSRDDNPSSGMRCIIKPAIQWQGNIRLRVTYLKFYSNEGQNQRSSCSRQCETGILPTNQPGCSLALCILQ